MKKLIIDRFEDGFAVVETPGHHFFDIPISILPEGVIEGSVIIVTTDPDEEKMRKERIAEKTKKLWKE